MTQTDSTVRFWQHITMPHGIDELFRTDTRASLSEGAYDALCTGHQSTSLFELARPKAENLGFEDGGVLPIGSCIEAAMRIVNEFDEQCYYCFPNEADVILTIFKGLLLDLKAKNWAYGEDGMSDHEPHVIAHQPIVGSESTPRSFVITRELNTLRLSTTSHWISGARLLVSIANME